MDAHGALDSLLGRLTAVLVSEAQLLGGVRGDVEFIKDEMENMNGLLMHVTEAQHYRDHQVRAWMKQVVGLTRDCEGCVELYVQYVGGRPGGDGVLGYLRRIPWLLRTIAVRHRIATRIRELKVRARDVGDRRLRYGVTVPSAPPDHLQNGGSGNNSSDELYDRSAPRLGGPEEEEADLERRGLLYGEPPSEADTVDKCANTVLEWIKEFQDGKGGPFSWPGLDIIGIAGRGSVGKTSIARRVYNHPFVVNSFRRRHWIDLGGLHGEVNDLLHVLRESLLTQTMLADQETWSKQKEGKKWFLLLVLDAAATGILYNSASAFILETRDIIRWPTVVILTTRDDEYNPWRSKTLLLSRKLKCTLPGFFHHRAISLCKCEHAPILAVLEECYPDVFALQMFLHLLYVNPYRSKTEMGTLSKALAQHRNNRSRIMLMFCYNELPVKYKTCLLYLSLFPRGHTLWRTSLIRRWLAEGLVTTTRIIDNSNNEGSSSSLAQLDDQAECVIDALVARGFLRPGETSASGKIKTCTMHHIVHSFIAMDLNFMDTSLPLHLAHRFSSNNGIALEQKIPSHASPSLKSDRPFHGILSLLDSLPGSDQWQLLKVLDLEGCRGLTKKHLKNISKILLLRYLSLRDTDVTQLPKKIDKLQCLETLDIRQTEIRAFATNSILLPMLKHLLAGNKVSNNSTPSTNSPRSESLATVRLPSGTRRMRRLEILSHVDASNNVDDLIDIGQLLQLRKLGVILNGRKAGSLALLFQQIEKLHGCLRALSVRINHPATSEGTVPETERLAALEYPPNLLQSLNISGITSGLPDWITELNQLTKLTLSETYLWEDGIRVFGKLRILRCLRLQRKSYIGTKLTFSAEEFKHLKSLIIEGCDINNIEFVNTGAAPKLEMLIWSFASVETLPLSGIDHLPKLKKIELNGDGDMAAVRKATEAHPNHPIFNHNPSHQRQEAGTD